MMPSAIWWGNRPTPASCSSARRHAIPYEHVTEASKGTRYFIMPRTKIQHSADDHRHSIVPGLKATARSMLGTAKGRIIKMNGKSPRWPPSKANSSLVWSYSCHNVMRLHQERAAVKHIMHLHNDRWCKLVTSIQCRTAEIWQCSNISYLLPLLAKCSTGEISHYKSKGLAIWNEYLSALRRHRCQMHVYCSRLSKCSIHAQYRLNGVFMARVV